MPFGRSDAGLKSLSVYRASVVQRMRTGSRAQHVVSTFICWCFHCSMAMPSAVCAVSAHCGQRVNQFAIPDPSTQQWYCRRRASFPRLIEAWYRNADVASLSPVAAGNQVLALVRRLSFSSGRKPVVFIGSLPVCAAASPFMSLRAQQGKPINFKAMS